jgi:ABC-type phosphate transport system substrate-binding protein
VHADAADPATATAIRDFVRWIVTPEAQRMALDLQYAPLPENVVALVTARLATLQAAGQPLP